MRRVLIPVLLVWLLAAQSPSASLTGKAMSISSDRITLQTAPGTARVLFVDEKSRIWRGNSTNLLSVRPGDDVMARYRSDSAGRLVIEDLWANIDHVWGRIAKTGTGEFEVDQNYNADPASAYMRRIRRISFDSSTRFEESAPGDLRAGRTADIIGLKVDNSGVRATRIIVYEGNVPVRMPARGRVILPNGATKIR